MSNVNWFSKTGDSLLHGWGLSHSYGENLMVKSGDKKKWKSFFLHINKVWRSSRHVLFNFFLLEKKSYLGRKSQPCCINDPIANHIQFIKVNCVCIFSGCGSCGDGVGHSYGVNLNFSLFLLINHTIKTNLSLISSQENKTIYKEKKKIWNIPC